MTGGFVDKIRVKVHVFIRIKTLDQAFRNVSVQLQFSKALQTSHMPHLRKNSCAIICKKKK